MVVNQPNGFGVFFAVKNEQITKFSWITEASNCQKPPIPSVAIAKTAKKWGVLYVIGVFESKCSFLRNLIHVGTAIYPEKAFETVERSL